MTLEYVRFLTVTRRSGSMQFFPGRSDDICVQHGGYVDHLFEFGVRRPRTADVAAIPPEGRHSAPQDGVVAHDPAIVEHIRPQLGGPGKLRVRCNQSIYVVPRD